MRAALIGLLRFAAAAALTLVTLVWIAPEAAAWGSGVGAAATFLGWTLVVNVWWPAPARASARRGTGLLVVVAVLLAAGAALALGHAVRPAKIVSTSMVPTILPGDRILVEQGGASAPRRGDVIVFRHEGEGEEGGALVKRVVGLPGDHIEMDDSRPVVNGKPVPSCDAGTFVYLGASRSSRGRLAVEWLDGQAYLTVQEHGPHVLGSYDVKPGEVFVLGDNRGISNDSRSWEAHPGVPLAAIEGRVHRVLFGSERDGALDRARVGARLGAELHVSGVDVEVLRAGVAKCLAAGPGAYLK